MTNKNNKTGSQFIYAVLVVLTAIFIFPIILVLMNSFKSRLYVSTVPFALPSGNMFVGLENYIKGLTTSGFFMAFLRSVWVSIASVALIIVGTSMTAWFIVRVKTKLTKALYYVFVFSMIVPFQMVMYTMTYVVNRLNFDNVLGINFVYLGFGAGLSVFMFTGFIKSIPLDLEEAAEIDGCNPLQTFFLIIFPVLKPTAITVAILNAMWIWNDYLLPSMMLGQNGRVKTLPVAVQAFVGSYVKEWNMILAAALLAIVPMIIIFLFAQKQIMSGMIEGAVKG